mgnify:CR=1 FL=1
MNRLYRWKWLVLSAALVALPFTAPTQAAGVSVSQGSSASLSQAELEQMLAPIALYPDSLLSHILIASTYPLEVVQAQRWLEDHPKLSTDQVMSRTEDKDWDPSVKALMAFPNVLQKMSEDLDWTQRLGEAFLADEAVVGVAQLHLGHGGVIALDHLGARLGEGGHGHQRGAAGDLAAAVGRDRAGIVADPAHRDARRRQVIAAGVVGQPVHHHQVLVARHAVDQVHGLLEVLGGQHFEHGQERRQARASRQKQQRARDGAQEEAAQRAGHGAEEAIRRALGHPGAVASR